MLLYEWMIVDVEVGGKIKQLGSNTAILDEPSVFGELFGLIFGQQKKMELKW